MVGKLLFLDIDIRQLSKYQYIRLQRYKAQNVHFKWTISVTFHAIDANYTGILETLISPKCVSGSNSNNFSIASYKQEMPSHYCRKFAIENKPKMTNSYLIRQRKLL